MPQVTVQQRAGSSLQVVHAMPGRVRLRAIGGESLIASSSVSEQVVDELESLLKNKQGICDISTNDAANSCTVTFNPEQLSLQQMLTLLEQEGITVIRPINPELSIFPLLTGMLVTQQLGIQGLPLLPIFLITAQYGSQFLKEVVSEPSANKILPFVAKKTDDSSVVYSIAHAITGRIRFYIPLVASDRPYSRRLERLIKEQPSVKDIRINPAAQSVAITYKGIPDEVMQSTLIKLIQKARIKTRPLHLTVAHHTVVTEHPKKIATVTPIKSAPTLKQPQPKSLLDWTDLKPPALSMILSFMTKLY